MQVVHNVRLYKKPAPGDAFVFVSDTVSPSVYVCIPADFGARGMNRVLGPGEVYAISLADGIPTVFPPNATLNIVVPTQTPIAFS